MISLKEYGIEKVYISNFLSGHGGDFFLTLLGRTHEEMYGFAEAPPLEWLKNRLVPEHPLMPGNNFAGKLINFESEDEPAKVISDEFRRLRAMYPGKEHDGNRLMLTAHYNDFSPFMVSEHLINNVDVDYCYTRMIPSTLESWLWIIFHYEEYIEDDSHGTEVIPSFIETASKLIMNDIQTNIADFNVDHIDLYLNNEDKLYDTTVSILGDIEIHRKAYEYVIQYYRHKMKMFKLWAKEHNTDEMYSLTKESIDRLNNAVNIINAGSK